MSDPSLRRPAQLAPHAHVPTPTGARAEASVLFSLASLREAEGRPSARPAAVDDGLIDLGALVSKRVARLPIPEPLPSEPPPAAFAQEIRESIPAPHARPQALFAVVGAAIVLLGLVGSGVALASSAEPAPEAQTLVREARALASRVEAPREAEPLASAPLVSTVVPAQSERIASAAPAHASGGKGAHHGRGGKSSAGKAHTSSASSSPAPKPVKAVDACGCHGDFQCSIRCSALGKK